MRKFKNTRPKFNSWFLFGFLIPFWYSIIGIVGAGLVLSQTEGPGAIGALPFIFLSMPAIFVLRTIGIPDSAYSNTRGLTSFFWLLIGALLLSFFGGILGLLIRKLFKTKTIFHN